MHISEGVLAAPVLAAGAGLAVLGLTVGLKKLRGEDTVLCAVLAAAFFVASLIHVPIGISNAHLILSGLLGVLLGWSAIPAIFIALLLQAVLFQYGGLTTLGVNTCSMGYGAVAAGYVFRIILAHFPGVSGIRFAAFCGGFLGIAFSALFTAVALAFSSEGFRMAAGALFLAHLPVMFIEGLITMFTVGIIYRVRPELLHFATPSIVEKQDDPAA